MAIKILSRYHRDSRFSVHRRAILQDRSCPRAAALRHRCRRRRGVRPRGECYQSIIERTWGNEGFSDPGSRHCSTIAKVALLRTSRLANFILRSLTRSFIVIVWPPVSCVILSNTANTCTVIVLLYYSCLLVFIRRELAPWLIVFCLYVHD